MNISFLVKEGSNNKKLDIILFACSRGVGKSLFHCSTAGTRIRKLWAFVYAMSKQSYVIQFFFMDFIFKLNAVKKG